MSVLLCTVPLKNCQGLIFFFFNMPVGGYFLNMMPAFETSWHFWRMAQEHQKWWERVKLEISRCGMGKRSQGRESRVSLCNKIKV